MGDWKPQKKQAEALIRKENEILYGGARGGGKTDAGMAWLLYDISNPRYRALVIRRNADDLKDWIDRAQKMYSGTRAQFVGVPVEIKFPSGAIIRTGHLKDENAYSKYQGHEYQKILIEELTHIPREEDFENLAASCRSTVPEIKPQIFATTNPDGPGHKWVKKRWQIPNEPGESVAFKDSNGLTRIFIPAKLEDNPKLKDADPMYQLRLESMKDEEMKRAWREGSWAGFNIEGSYYHNELALAYKENRITNVPYDSKISVNTYWDLGMGDSTSVLFMQNVGLEWRMIDYYEASGEGLLHYFKILQEKGYVYGEHYAPADIEVRELTGTGQTRREYAASLGVNFIVVPKSNPEEGIEAVRRRFNTLWIDKTRCDKFLDAISQYRKEWNEKMADWKPRPLHDWSSHAADALRYWATAPEPYRGTYKTSY